jgi:transposase
MNKIITIGIDLAKNVFQLHMADKLGKKIDTKRLSRNKIIEFLANTPCCLIWYRSLWWCTLLGTRISGIRA